MTAQPFGQEGGMLAQVREGMAVHDRDNEQIGTVKGVNMRGGNDPADVRRQQADAGVRSGDPTDTAPGTLADTLAEVVGTTGSLGSLPDEVRLKLERDGYIEIDSAGFFAADRYATPSQIAEVSGDRVLLNVSQDELAKR